MAMMEKNKEFEKQDELREKYNELNSVKNMVIDRVLLIVTT